MTGWPGYRHDQYKAHDFVKTTFGESSLARVERVRRVMEEAIELAQAVGLPWQELETITMHVYRKPKGEITQEIAGTAMCLMALCEVEGLYLDRLAQREIQRVRRLDPDHFRARQTAKALVGIGLMPDEPVGKNITIQGGARP